jgi:hypothetical protein
MKCIAARLRPRHVLITSVIVLWLAAVSTGMTMLSLYAAKPGPTVPDEAGNVAGATWPRATVLERAAHGATLVVAVHPKCGCSRATLGELARIMSCAPPGSGTRAYVLMTVPVGLPDSWARGANWDAAAQIPGVQLVIDHDGATARLFGAMTSGHTCAFDASGQLLFSGGITAARGHMGDSAGGDAVRAVLTGHTPAVSRGAVFGCGLESPRGN